MKDSRRRDDIRNLSLVWGAGITAGILTLALLLRGEEPRTVEAIPEHDPPPVEVAIPEIEIEPAPAPEPVVVQVVSGSNRLFGTVTTIRGDRYEGFIRWDRNEGSWADLLEANKPGSRNFTFRTGDRSRALIASMERDRARLERDRTRAVRDRARLERRVEAEARRIERVVTAALQAGEDTREDTEEEAHDRAERVREQTERARERTERVRQQTAELREKLRELELDIEVDVDPEADVRISDDGVVVVSGSDSRIRVARPKVSISAIRAPKAPTPPTISTWTHRVSSNTESGLRFGHIDRIQALDSRNALFTLRSGETVELSGSATDLGSGLRALIVETLDGQIIEMGWSDLDHVDFYPAPESATPSNERMYGTMTTDSGMEFTGYVTWDVDEIYSTDVLDGDDRGLDREIPFGQISRIERYSSQSALVTLNDGTEVVLDDSNDVDSSNSGISVSDPLLGQVKVPWDVFESVEFHEAESHAGYGSFDGGLPLRGTVITTDGQEFSGRLVYDRDEAFTWELLNGDGAGIEFQIEFGNIDRIERNRRGTSTVTLRDGRAFKLGGSNDVGGGNRGIVVENDGDARLIDWDDVREVRFEGR